MSHPLLLKNTEVYVGPWAPCPNAEGHVQVEGLVAGEDEIVIRIRDTQEEMDDTVLTISCSTSADIGPFEKALIRAERTKSSGKEVSVWVS